jgi:hypothetical protein
MAEYQPEKLLADFQGEHQKVGAGDREDKKRDGKI